ncbi:hypothetical protein E6P09_07590 [Haloferax mediterranei ATCC 33500]|uniref:Uncharacterized protein n=1 Tax=Haloferax mediterranei (strain ATCC 33500 / DSM 1411 / JCM 8866 / NBRC 14739 / NCIMB 2177 / R-4) TaxID=523841 RepID=I3R320_HALMT|nr:hypothetical protein [Haloferax mediterranei]AFK18630.1 hypothetical protein HFX_0909 [Haloferax mediterranei ATCC 33500]AHZ21998.1 hypothetical protein BM92_04670 [Haloferax mediterranei ATCC 33500]EMA02094.1 hypothetical protein C439_05925 [Haloferax mediterranei ATCC 33500]MDX5988723.1 hypothetical protein [Haloferax mediterranei ATCC 33500]QCQ75130.1 hypothetical protein E6P09_07590 [Haloferax mediterranei ATCC 33500]
MGDVAVTANGHTHAMEVDSLDGDIDVDVDADVNPHVRLPADVHVFYVDDNLETDGGAAATTRTRVEGYGLSGPVRDYAMAGSLLLAAITGWLWGSASGSVQVTAFLTALIAGGLGLVTYRSATAEVRNVAE